MSGLHHIALGARDVAKVAEFYSAAFGLSVAARHDYEDGRLRSIWLKLDAGVLMVEHTEQERALINGVGAGPFLLAFAMSEDERSEWEEWMRTHGYAIESRSRYSTYARDPEGNRVAVSAYPFAD